MFEHIDITGNGQTHISDYHGGCESSENSKNSIFEQLANLQHLLSSTRIWIDQQELARHEDQFIRVRDWIAGPRVAVYHEKALALYRYGFVDIERRSIATLVERRLTPQVHTLDARHPWRRCVSIV